MSSNYYIIPIFVPHEGCPHNCVFCNQNKITGSNVLVDGEYAKNCIESYLKTIENKNATKEVSFYGGTFTAIPTKKQNELLDVAKYYKDRGYINHIRLSTRPDYINKDILENLKKHSVDIIELGIQSMDEDVLIKSGRGHGTKEVYNAVSLIKSFGFVLGVQMMIGLVGDNKVKDIYTAKILASLKPDLCRIYPSLVIKDTPMEKMYKEKKYIPYTLMEAIDISKIAYGIFYLNNVNIIRIGLQPTEEINELNDVVGGPFHPAFREIVEGSIYNDIVSDFIETNEDNTIIKINSKDISKLYCMRKEFFLKTIEKYPNIDIKVIQDDSIDRNSIELINNKARNLITFKEFFIKAL